MKIKKRNIELATSVSSILRDKSKTCELISFGEKTTNIDNIEEIIELICLLTKTRGRMIISLLKKKNP